MPNTTLNSSMIANHRLTRSASTKLKDLEYAKVISHYSTSRELAKLALKQPKPVQFVQTPIALNTPSRHALSIGMSLRSGRSSVARIGKVTKWAKRPKAPVYRGPGYSSKAVKGGGRRKGKECSICAETKEL